MGTPRKRKGREEEQNQPQPYDKITANEQGLREALMMLVPIASKYAYNGSGVWANFLLKLAERKLPEWGEKNKNKINPDEYTAVLGAMMGDTPDQLDG